MTLDWGGVTSDSNAFSPDMGVCVFEDDLRHC